jgi:hypothetical protein
MVCKHLAALEQALIRRGVKVTFRGAAWSKNCREWAYFDVRLDIAAIQERFAFPGCVQVHENKDPRSGRERGFVCDSCNDGLMGKIDGGPVFP